MGERYIYMPSYYFYLLLLMLSVILVFLLYLAFLDKTIIGYLTTAMISVVFLSIIVFSYLSYKGKIPYMILINGKLYATKYNFYLLVFISVIFSIYLSVLYFIKRGNFSLVAIFLVLTILAISIVFTYLSFKRKIPLLKIGLE